MSHVTLASREAIVATAGEIIAMGSRSFALASRLFGRRTRERAWLLYAWCRACDDLADGQTLGHDAVGIDDPAARLALIRRWTDQAMAGEPVGHPAFDALRHLDAVRPLPRRFVTDLVDGFALDAAGWRPTDEADMLRYCYHVAGAVGCLMAVVMGVDPADEATLDRACDLGIAFQLSNIARDIQDDARIGRRYLPADWLAELGLAEEALAEPGAHPAVAVLAGRLAQRAREYAASARVGAARLPFRSRWAVLAAAGIYGAIAEEVARRGERAWDRRVTIGGGRKLALATRALSEAVAPRGGGPRPDNLWTRPNQA